MTAANHWQSGYIAATTNAEAAFSAAQAMATAKSLTEIAKLQSEFVQKFAAQAAEQTKEFLDLSTRATQHLFEKAQVAAGDAADEEGLSEGVGGRPSPSLPDFQANFGERIGCGNLRPGRHTHNLRRPGGSFHPAAAARRPPIGPEREEKWKSELPASHRGDRDRRSSAAPSVVYEIGLQPRTQQAGGLLIGLPL